MEKTALVPPPIANAADYIDALIRPRSREAVVSKRIVPGRRMRDKFREEVVVIEVIKKPG